MGVSVMAVFCLLILSIACGCGIAKQFNSEKYANKVVHNKNTNFFGFIFDNHPVVAFLIVLVVVFAIIAIFYGSSSANTCPRCGKTWHGEGYCYTCRAAIKRYG